MSTSAISSRATGRLAPPPEPSRDGSARPLGAARRYWWLILLCAALLGAGAAVAGYLRPPTYEAESQLNVGRLDVTAQSLPGYADAGQNLAQSYSEVVTGDAVILPAARRLRTDPAELRDAVSAAPVPGSSVLYVRARASDEGLARQRAGVVVDELGRYVGGLNTTQQTQRRLLDAYVRTQQQLSGIDRQIGQLSAKVRFDDATAADRARLRRLRVQRAETALRARALTSNYLGSKFELPSTPSLRVVRRPTSTGSTRARTTTALGVAGLIVGALDGLALAVLLGRRRLRRRLAA